MEDKKISDISKLLIKGAKMLSYHCPDCKIPLFQEGERIFCPSCNREAVIEKTENKKDRQKENNLISKQGYSESGIKTAKSENTKQKIGVRETKKFELSDIDASFRNTIFRLSKSLEDAKDLNEIKEIVETIDKITILMERIRRI